MSTSYLLIGGIAGAVIILSLITWLVWRRRFKGLNTRYYAKQWKALQLNCARRKTWPKAIIDADNLLDEALRGRHYKGKTTGERLVAAQHDLSSNDMVWYGHKLRNQIVDKDVRTLKKQDILNALAGFRQALKDLGALR